MSFKNIKVSIVYENGKKDIERRLWKNTHRDTFEKEVLYWLQLTNRRRKKLKNCIKIIFNYEDSPQIYNRNLILKKLNPKDISFLKEL